MRVPRPGDAEAVGAGPRRIGAAIAVLAVLLPVAGLLTAGTRARAAVVESVLVGQAATAQAVAAQVELAYTQGTALSRAARDRPGVQDGLQRGDAPLLARELTNVVAAGPFADAAAYDSSGRLLSSVHSAERQLPATPDSEQVGPPRVTGEDSLIEVVEPVVVDGRQVGALRLTLSFRRFLPDLAQLRYGRTGTTAIIATDGTFLLTVDDVLRGQKLLNPAALALAAGHQPGHLRAYSTRFHTPITSVYAPVGGSTLGVLTRQFDSEAFATADRLRQRLRLAALGVLVVGLILMGVGAYVLRRYRQRLNHRDAELRDLVERSDDILARTGADRRCLYISPAVYDVLGYRPAERIGHDPLELIHPDDRERFTRDGLRHGTEDSITRSFRMVHRDGHDVWVEMTGVVDRARNGAITGYNSVTRDITARHRARVELAATRDAALAASESKSVFLANTSHELRTPLNGILGLTEVLLGTELTLLQREYAQTVSDSGRSLLTILDDILDLAKVEAGKVELERVAFALGAVVDRAAAPFRPLAAAKDLSLEVTVDPALPAWVLGDPTRFAQVLANLLSNAVKFTASGRVDVRVRRVHGRPDLVEVEVADTGIGIARAAMGSLFEAFSQADSSTTRRYGGTGLGLAVSRQLAELQGGTLTPASVVGQGSTFVVVVPLPATDAPVPAQVPARPAPGARSLRVLVAEDNAVNQLVARTMLEQLGHRVDVVEDGRAAVAAVLGPGGEPYDAVLMDCQMPVLDGYAATEAIRSAQAGRARTPILGLTASAMTQEREQGLAAGMDRYLTKPIGLQDLDRALLSVCGPGRAALPVATP